MSKVKNKLGWTSKTTIDELVNEMVRKDLKTAENDKLMENTAKSLLIATSK